MVVNKQIQIKTSLPYCLYRIDTRFFKLNDGFNSKIRFLKVETTPNRRTQFSQNIEVIRDRWGIDAHSDVEIYTSKVFSNSDEAETFALKLVNDFIRRYRYYHKGAIHLVPLIKEDLFEFNILTNGKGRMSVSFAGGMTIVSPLLNYEISTKVEQSIVNKEEIPLWEELLLKAEQYLYQAEYRHSILESITALELVTSDFIRIKCRQKAISKKDADSYIERVGLTGSIKVTIKLLLNKVKLPEEKVFQKCKASITARNHIVHEGKDATTIEARDSLKYGKILIDFLVQYL